MTTDEKLDLLCVNVQSINENVIQMKGDIAEMKGDIAHLQEDMVEVKGDIAEMKGDIAHLQEDMVEVKGDITHLKEEVVEMKEDIYHKLEVMDGTIQQVSGNVRDLRLIVENEIRPYINIIAEGHANLDRKLDAAIESASTLELTKMRVCILEEDVKKIKAVVNL